MNKKGVLLFFFFKLINKQQSMLGFPQFAGVDFQKAEQLFFCQNINLRQNPPFSIFQRGCGIPVLGATRSLAGRSPVQPALSGSVWTWPPPEVLLWDAGAPGCEKPFLVCSCSTGRLAAIL